MDTAAMTGRPTDRRKNKRFRVRGMALAVVRPYLIHRNPVGAINDISLKGLSFSYVVNAETTRELPELDVCLQDNGFYVCKIPFETVSDFEVKEPCAFRPMGLRRRGVQFGDLSEKQVSQLEYFIENYALGEL
jgi:hypothetical protein